MVKKNEYEKFATIEKLFPIIATLILNMCMFISILPHELSYLS